MTTISDITELTKGSAINKISVTIKKAFPAKEGENKGKPWRLQAAILEDETGDIRATFWNKFNTDLRNFEGESVTIVSGTDKRGKFSGIEVDEYEGKRQLKISENATFASEDTPEENGVTTITSEDNGVTTHAPTPARRFVSEETKRESIEKQVALKAAAEFLKCADPEDVIKAAEVFYKFLHGEPEVI